MTIKPAKKLNQIYPAVFYGIWLTKADFDKVNETPLYTDKGEISADDTGQYVMHSLLTQHYDITGKVVGKAHWGAVNGLPYRSLRYRDSAFAKVDPRFVFLGYRMPLDVLIEPSEVIRPNAQTPGQINWINIMLYSSMVSERIRQHGIETLPIPNTLEQALFMLPTDALKHSKHLESVPRDITQRLGIYTGNTKSNPTP